MPGRGLRIALLLGVASLLLSQAPRILKEGGDIDYEGAAGTLDWDENGDLSRGAVGIWRFTEDGSIEDVDIVAYER